MSKFPYQPPRFFPPIPLYSDILNQPLSPLQTIIKCMYACFGDGMYWIDIDRYFLW